MGCRLHIVLRTAINWACKSGHAKKPIDTSDQIQFRAKWPKTAATIAYSQMQHGESVDTGSQMRDWHKTLVIVSIGLLIGVPVGTSTATFIFADGFSYLSANPKACMNCHVMKDGFNSWEASSHHAFTSCNDCHTSGSTVSKYSQKAVNGILHSWAFSTGRFKEPIQIKDFNKKIVMQNCLQCHAQMIESSQFAHLGFGQSSCLSCHQNTGHRKW